MALQSGMKKGGAAKGELVISIYELANCFRSGWGIPKDPVAAKQVSAPYPTSACGNSERGYADTASCANKQYYETAANLGDIGKPLEL